MSWLVCPVQGREAALCLDIRVSLSGAWCFSAALCGLAPFSLLHIPCIAFSCRVSAEGHSPSLLMDSLVLDLIQQHRKKAAPRRCLLGFSSSIESYDRAQGSCHAHPCVSASMEETAGLRLSELGCCSVVPGERQAGEKLNLQICSWALR